MRRLQPLHARLSRGRLHHDGRSADRQEADVLAAIPGGVGQEPEVRAARLSRALTMATTATTQSELPIFVAGKWRVPPAKTFGNVFNPSIGEVIARVPFCGATEVDDAVKAARAAFVSWSQTPAPKRATVMFKYRSLIEQHFEE